MSTVIEALRQHSTEMFGLTLEDICRITNLPRRKVVAQLTHLERVHRIKSRMIDITPKHSKTPSWKKEYAIKEEFK